LKILIFDGIYIVIDWRFCKKSNSYFRWRWLNGLRSKKNKFCGLFTSPL